ncbi:MAG: hypothetical protein LBQ40_04260 [Clostridiales bacterium]|jgi:hypothetical protein|nr:hypothetical protein [Clostridiales bacterium]
MENWNDTLVKQSYKCADGPDSKGFDVVFNKGGASLGAKLPEPVKPKPKIKLKRKYNAVFKAPFITTPENADAIQRGGAVPVFDGGKKKKR